MLVLTRRHNEKIIIGNRLVNITLLHIGKTSVRIGIDAPKELSVHREEIYDKIKFGVEEGNKDDNS